MKILVHDYAGHPFQVQLSRNLALRGHDVLHVFSSSNLTPQGALQKSEHDPTSFNISPIRLKEQIDKQNLIKRRNQEKEHGGNVARVIEEFNPQIILSANSPLDSQKILQATARRKGIPMVYWLQDILGVGMHMLLKKKAPIIGNFVGHYYRQLEESLLKESAAVIAISEDFNSVLLPMGINPNNIHIIENWAPLDEVPMRPKDNSWTKKQELNQNFNFVYSGTLGLKHNPSLLTALAEAFREAPDVRIIVISEGPGRQWLEERKLEKKLDNLLLMDYQPFSDVPNVLGCADVVMAILDPSAGIFSVPSKVMTYMCSGRAMLLAVPLENLASRIVGKNETGLTCAPTDEAGFVKSGRALYNDAGVRERMGVNARAYAERAFNIDAISDRFERVFKQAAKTSKPGTL
jgi:glycosyltransferase involved in cell wall biosynthesis